MDKKECLKLMGQYFHIDSLINKLKHPDFELKSHIFYYRDIFKEVDEIPILRVSSNQIEDDIIFDVYYVSGSFEGLFHGYFRIHPKTTMAEKIFQNTSRVCTDLGYYFYYIYQNSDLLKRYFISGNLQNMLDEDQQNNFKNKFEVIKKETYMDIAKYDMKDLQHSFLRKDQFKKYITDFIRFNGKCSEKVKMFLISILSGKNKDAICFINNEKYIKTFISVDIKSVTISNKPQIPIHGLINYAVNNNLILFLKLEFNFEGGDTIGKISSQR